MRGRCCAQPFFRTSYADRRPAGAMHLLGKPLSLNKLRAVLLAIDLANTPA